MPQNRYCCPHQNVYSLNSLFGSINVWTREVVDKHFGSLDLHEWCFHSAMSQCQVWPHVMLELDLLHPLNGIETLLRWVKPSVKFAVPVPSKGTAHFTQGSTHHNRLDISPPRHQHVSTAFECPIPEPASLHGDRASMTTFGTCGTTGWERGRIGKSLDLDIALYECRGAMISHDLHEIPNSIPFLAFRLLYCKQPSFLAG